MVDIPGGVNARKGRRSRFDAKPDPILTDLFSMDVVFNKLATFSNVGGAVEFAAVALAPFPKGDLIVYGGVLSLDVTEDPLTANIVNTYNVTASLGSTATVDNTLATTEINLLTAAAAGAATASVSPHIKRVLDGAAVGGIVDAGATVAKYLDNNAGALAAFLNLTLPDADISGGPATLRVKGVLRLLGMFFGKNS